jgi:hypothetical protein
LRHNGRFCSVLTAMEAPLHAPVSFSSWLVVCCLFTLLTSWFCVNTPVAGIETR